MKVQYLAAHAGISLGQVPIGGGGAVCSHLASEWNRTNPFDLEVISPAILGDRAPKDFDLVRMSEWDYARFCLDFERASTEAVLRDRPQAVLCNDVSEGPDFQRLAEAGHRLYTIYHVDVLDYFARMYLRGWVSPEKSASFYRAIEKSPLRHAVPRILELVLKKQEHSVRYSRGNIVPSAAMKDVLLSCYPATDPARIHVLPWGIWDEPIDELAIQSEVDALRSTLKVTPGQPVLALLSRISPEKGQDRLLEAMALWEQQPDFPKEGVRVILAGEPAYMQGERFLKRLKALSSRLRRSAVHFAGYAAGAKKQAIFRLADLYVFPSRHESYGLTMLEAMKAGVPVLATSTHGARDAFQPGWGALTASAEGKSVPVQLMEALRNLLADRSRLKEMGKAAQGYARNQRFSDSARRMADLILSDG